jgi:hypothetical protein
VHGTLRDAFIYARQEIHAGQHASGSSQQAPDLAGPDIVKFGIESKYETSTKQFKEVIVNAMQDMQVVCGHAQVKTGEVNSKL